MDSLTQIILGASTGLAVSGKQIGNKAALWGAIGGTIPDLDVVLGLWNSPVYSDHYHRGFSHSLLFAIGCSLLFAFFLDRVKPNLYQRKNTFFLFLIAIGTHPLLDSFTRWGTQFLWPLDIRWHWNGVFVIDPLYTVPFGILLLIALRSKNIKRKIRLNKIGLILSSFYLVIGMMLQSFVVKKVDADYAAPMPFTNLSWLIIKEDKDQFVISQYNIITGRAVNEQFLYKNHELSEAFFQEESSVFEIAKSFAQNYYTLYLSSDRDTLYFYDLRFGVTNSFQENSSNGVPIRGYKFYYAGERLVNEHYRTMWRPDFSLNSYFRSIFE